MDDNGKDDVILLDIDDGEKRREKKFRKRKKKLYKVIREQMEFYFSDSNLSKDKFMSSTISESTDGYVALDVFLKFNKIQALTTNLEELAQALSTSDILELDESTQKIRRTTPIQKRNDFDESTIYVENLPYYVDHEWLKNIFSAYGQVTYVNLPKYKSTKQHKGFAFVEFDSPKSAKLACEHFGASIDDFKELKMENNDSKDSRKRSRSPSFTHNIDDDEIEEDEEDHNKSPSKKRKKRNEETSTQTAIMIAESKEASNEIDVDIERSKKKKKRKRQKKSKQKINAETNQLRVLSKLQWKSLRNRYLTLQKNNMTRLKKSLMLLNQNLPVANDTVPQNKVLKDSSSDGTIIKLIPIKDILDIRQFKESALTIANVQYIDNHSSEEEIFIRCETTADAFHLLHSEFLGKYGEANLLKGEEEKAYLNKIEEDRKNKYNSKNRIKRRGREKIIARAEQFLEKPKPKHIRFDDE